MGKFSAIQIGQTAEISHKITDADIERFVALTGDDNRLHVDSEYAKITSFKKPVVHGMLSASFISTIIGTKIPGDGALWFSQNLEFIMPVRVGDIITVRAEVISKHERMSMIELSTDIFNQNKQKVVAGVAKVKIIEPSEGEILISESLPAKTALIIGATGGIGEATALQLAEDGFDLLLHYHRNKEMAESLKKRLEASGRHAYLVSGDLMLPDDCDKIVFEVKRRFLALGAIVNCATIPIGNIKLQSLTWGDIQQHLDINIRALFHLVQGLIPILETKNGSSIVAISSIITDYPVQEWTHYITAKSALNGFCKALSLELASKKIRVNLVSPSLTETELNVNLSEKARLLTIAKTPLKRLGLPEDVAAAIAFLVSERSKFITGETIRVNGGQMMV